MVTHVDEVQSKKSQSAAHTEQTKGHSKYELEDNRPQGIAHTKLQEIAINKPRAKQLKALDSVINYNTIQREPFDENGNDLGSSSNLKDAMKAVDGAFFGLFNGNVGPLNSGSRSELRDHIDTLPKQLPFTQIVQSVNQSLGVNTDAVLPPVKLAEYKRLTTELSQGKIKDSEAMRQSSIGWFKFGNYPASLLNAFGAIGFYVKEGVDADIARKTGQG